MPKYPASNKQTTFVKPLIKKGFYPAVLLSVEPYLGKDKLPVVGKWGKQLILEFLIYKPDEQGCPTAPMQYVLNPENPTELNDVVIAKFVYHQYKDKTSGEFQTAFTPNSAITKTFEALGWEFSDEGIDTDEYVGRWAEVLVADYTYEEGKVASTIQEVNKYKGPAVKNIPVPEKKEPKKVEKKVKHEAVQAIEESSEVKELRAKIVQLEKLHSDGLLTKEGLEKAKEQLNTQIKEALEKK